MSVIAFNRHGNVSSPFVLSERIFSIAKMTLFSEFNSNPAMSVIHKILLISMLSLKLSAFRVSVK